MLAFNATLCQIPSIFIYLPRCHISVQRKHAKHNKIPISNEKSKHRSFFSLMLLFFYLFIFFFVFSLFFAFKYTISLGALHFV